MKFYKNKKILITGNTGFKGSWLSLILFSFGSKIIGYSDKKPEKNSLLKKEWIKKNIVQYYNKIENYTLLESVIQNEKPDFIFHLAAQPLVLESYKYPFQTFQTNVIGTLNLLEIIKKINKNIATIVITTDKVYSNEVKRDQKEDNKLEGIDPYSSSKICAEHIAKSYSNLGIKVITARAGNIIGGGDWSNNRIVPDIIRSYIQHKPITIRNPSFTRPWLYVLDALEGYLLLGKRLYQIKSKSYFNSFNLSPDDKKKYNVLDLTKKFLAHLNKNQYLYCNNNYGKENKYLSLNSNKIKKFVNWRAKTKFDQAVEHTAKWYLYNNTSANLSYSEKHISEYFNIDKKFNNNINYQETKHA